MDHVVDLIREYSYWAIIFGVLLEGDLTLIVSGMLAHEKILDFGFGTAFLAAMAGALLGDLVAFVVGRKVRGSISETRFYQKFHPRMEWLDLRFGVLSIILVKYIYGLRFASSVFWGMSRMSVMRFLALTLVSCGVWVGMLTGLGYLFGTAIGELLERSNAVIFTLAAAVVVGGLLYVVHHWWLSPTLQHEAERAGLTHELFPSDAPPEKPGGETTELPNLPAADTKRIPSIPASADIP